MRHLRGRLAVSCYAKSFILTSPANASRNGIVWAIEHSAPFDILHAFVASNLANELYNSNQAGNRDRFGTASHFGTPMIVNGKVYLGTAKGIAVFGLLKR
jgi:hypothetical protein